MNLQRGTVSPHRLLLQIRKRSHSTAMANHQGEVIDTSDPMERLAQLLRDACEVCASGCVNIHIRTA